MKDKKALQLGMNPSTASGRLVKDVLFHLVCETGKNVCHQCGEPMTRENFSIEHKVPWLDSEKPVEMFFDLSNIAFSHHSCNVGAARRNLVTEHGKAMYAKGCRCDICSAAKRSENSSRTFCPEKRREKYIRTGK